MHYIKGSNYIWQTASYDIIKKIGFALTIALMAILKKMLGVKLLLRVFFISHCYRIFYRLRKTKSTGPKKLGATMEQRMRIFILNIA